MNHQVGWMENGGIPNSLLAVAAIVRVRFNRRLTFLINQFALQPIVSVNCADYHRNKIQNDSDYRQVCLDSPRKWRATHPDYWKNYRASFGSRRAKPAQATPAGSVPAACQSCKQQLSLYASLCFRNIYSPAWDPRMILQTTTFWRGCRFGRITIAGDT